jgi:ribonuclease HI
MELKAIMKELDQPFSTNHAYVIIESNSQGCLDMMLGRGDQWEANNWRNPSGNQVQNQQFVERMTSALRLLSVEFRKVARHKGEERNEVVDILAVKGRNDQPT